MQPAFDLGLLAAPSALIFAAVLLAGWHVGASPALTWALALAKTSLYFVYFGVFFDGSFTFIDDWTYLERGAALHAAGVRWFNMFDSLPLLLAVGEGNHFLYYSFNATAIGTFGEGYFAPVAVNVVISVAVAWLATRLVVAEGLCVPRLAPAFFAFMTLHPDILAWSTVLNGKDTLVLLLHVLLLTAVSWFLKGWRWRALVLAATATAVLLFLRFYVPVLFAIALAVVGALGMSRTARWRMLGLSALVGSGLVWQMGGAGLQSVLDALRAEFVNPVWGLLRFTLTPIPFNTSPEYAFLDFPALLHWLFLPAAVLGFLTVLRTPTPFARYLAVYTLVFVALYAVYGELQGPRHRLQLDFAWATFQFIGIGVLVRLLATISVRRRSSGRADHFTQSPTP